MSASLVGSEMCIRDRNSYYAAPTTAIAMAVVVIARVVGVGHLDMLPSACLLYTSDAADDM
eukprot:7231045-Alexandrium_andersonii.AAC.1